MQKERNGFTLVELIIVMACLGILAAIAVPMYNEHIRQSHRATAKAALVEAAQNMERYYTRNNTYAGAAVDPPSSGGGRYLLDFSGGPTASTFTIRGVPQGAQVADKCGTLTINQAGAKTPSLAGCW